MAEKTASPVEITLDKETWAVLAEALAEAKTAAENEKATQSEVDAALANLQAAVDLLETKPVPPEKPERPEGPGCPGRPEKTECRFSKMLVWFE